MDSHFHYDMEWHCAVWHLKSNVIFLLSKQHRYNHREMSENSLTAGMLAFKSRAVWMLWLLTRLFIHVYIWIRVCVSLQAYRFLAINKKLGLSGRPERPVGCIGTCKVSANTPTHVYIAVHVHTHGMYAPCCPAAQVRGEYWTHCPYIDLHSFPRAPRSRVQLKISPQRHSVPKVFSSWVIQYASVNAE